MIRDRNVWTVEKRKQTQTKAKAPGPLITRFTHIPPRQVLPRSLGQIFGVIRPEAYAPKSAGWTFATSSLFILPSRWKVLPIPEREKHTRVTPSPMAKAVHLVGVTKAGPEAGMIAIERLDAVSRDHKNDLRLFDRLPNQDKTATDLAFWRAISHICQQHLRGLKARNPQLNAHIVQWCRDCGAFLPLHGTVH